VWGEILSTEGTGNLPAFNRLERLADELRFSQGDDILPEKPSPNQLKVEALSMIDKYLHPNSPELRAVVSYISHFVVSPYLFNTVT